MMTDRLIANPLRYLAIPVLLAGCSGQAADGHSGRTEDRDAAAVAEAETGQAQATPAAKPLSESDRINLSMAGQQCANGDARSFVDTFIMSEAVRRKYSAPDIAFLVRDDDGAVQRRETIASGDYRQFPLRMWDYYRRPVEALSPRGDEYAEIEFNQSQTNRIALEWSRVRYVGPTGEGDGLGTPINLDGSPYESGQAMEGQLLFEPTKDCWRLIEDSRYGEGAAT